MPTWNAQGSLKSELEARLKVEGHTTEEALRQAFPMLAHSLYDSMEAHGKAGADTVAVHAHAFVQEWTSLLLGTPSPHTELFERG